VAENVQTCLSLLNSLKRVALKSHDAPHDDCHVTILSCSTHFGEMNSLKRV